MIKWWLKKRYHNELMISPSVLRSPPLEEYLRMVLELYSTSETQRSGNNSKKWMNWTQEVMSTPLAISTANVRQTVCLSFLSVQGVCLPYHSMHLNSSWATFWWCGSYSPTPAFHQSIICEQLNKHSFSSFHFWKHYKLQTCIN